MLPVPHGAVSGYPAISDRVRSAAGGLAWLRAGSRKRSATALPFHSLAAVARPGRTPKFGMGGLCFRCQASLSGESASRGGVYGDPGTRVGPTGYAGRRVRTRTKPDCLDRWVAHSHRRASVWATGADALDIGVRRQRPVAGAGWFFETSGRA